MLSVLDYLIISIYYKSVTIFCPLGRKGSIAVVVSPLTSLMMDQQHKFLPRGISVEFLGEAQKDEKIISSVLDGKTQLVYISPESLMQNKRYWNMFQGRSYQENMISFVVDEAHCVRLW